MGIKKCIAVGLLALACVLICIQDIPAYTNDSPTTISVNEVSNFELIVEVKETEVVIDTTPDQKVEKKDPEVKTEVRKKSSYKEYNIPEYSGKKSWMRYQKITKKNSPQLALQQKATTDQNGFRKLDGRYMVAVGTCFNAGVGTNIDLVLKNGTVIKCVVGDIKANEHTDSANMFTSNGCMSEFIVDKATLNAAVKRDGDCSSLQDSWNSPVAKVLVYK